MNLNFPTHNSRAPLCCELLSLSFLDAIKYYSDAKNRGYLAHPEQIQEERFTLAQKYGYEVSEITEEFLRESKDPRQVFYGLEPGWLINLADKEIYKPTDPELIDYYKS